MLRARSFSITLGSPNGQRAATRKGRGSRPSCRRTASLSEKASGIGVRVFREKCRIGP